MEGILLAAASCFFLGVITTIHPCPLATNIAAVSLLSGWSSKSGKNIYPYILFIAGYVAVFMLIAFLISAGIYARSSVSLYLQSSLRLLLGPVLILVGMVLADLIRLLLDHGFLPTVVALSAFRFFLPLGQGIKQYLNRKRSDHCHHD